MVKFFTKLLKAGEVTVSTLKRMLKEHGGENVSLIQRRLNWFSWGRYDKHNWHLTVKQVNGKPSQADKVRFHQIEDTHEAIIAVLRRSGRGDVADRLVYLRCLAREDPDEAPMDLDSLRAMAHLLMSERQLQIRGPASRQMDSSILSGVSRPTVSLPWCSCPPT